MKTWKYSGRDSRGSPIKGSVSAMSLVDANAKVLSLGVVNPTIADSDAIIPQKAVVPPSLPPPEPQVQKPLVPPGPPPVVKRPIDCRREYVVTGPPTQVMGIIEPMLDLRNGVVKHMVIHPDAHGKMEMAVVVECDRTE